SQCLGVMLSFFAIIVVRDCRDLRISLAVSPYIRKAVGSFRVRPPVRSLAHVIMLVATWRDPVFLHDRKRTLFHRTFSGFASSDDNFTFRSLLLLLSQSFCVEQENARQAGILLLRVDCRTN